ncbi:RNA-binding protein 34 [Hyperolius riggenbachi]|uniref:RNA-binding protein 34 n=1 Tax=Hyperolius riggenbachi TaxID=752182 RepID=UPI0035A2BCCF
MTKEDLKRKPKKVKKLKKQSEVICEAKSQELAPEAEGYVAGEVASSLFSKKPTPSTTALSSLFSTKACALQPLYVPVVVTKPKRKLPEPEEEEQDIPADAAKTTKKPPKVVKKEQTVAEKRLADRESALLNADEDETAKKTQVKKSKKSTDEELPPHAKKKLIMAEERVKNKRTVFVGNLPVSCTKQMLNTCFKEFGPIESMRFRSMARADASLTKKVATIQRKIHPNRKNINAYVVFKEQESAAKALVRNGMEITSGFHIRVDLAAKSSAHDNRKSAFVGNLPYEVEEEALRSHFAECGTVEAVRIIRDKRTGIGKGFGYVLFQGADAVQLALKLNNSELLGRKIRVKRCQTSEGQHTQKNTAFRQKLETLKPGKVKKNKSFVGETANTTKSTKSKSKKPKNKKKKTKGQRVL